MTRIGIVGVVVLGACASAPAPADFVVAETGTTLARDVTSSSGESGSSSSSSTSGGPASQRTSVVIRGANVVGLGEVDVLVRGGRIAQVGAIADRIDAEVVDEAGHFVVPAFVDSHVHLSYAFDARTLAKGGIAAAVDLAAPIDALAQPSDPIVLLGAGPMITAVGGYPTQSWGAGGFGLEVAGVEEVRDAVDRVVDAGAAVVKVPIGTGPVLGHDELVALVERAHARDRKVVAHALTDADAREAAAVGVDVLAHTPIEALADDTVLAWSNRAVITTLDAFGARPETLDNLSRLRAAGATILYGTDLGNTGIPAIDHNEIDALRAVGLDGADIIAAGTATPAAFWNLEGLGTITKGARASFLVVEQDPREDPQTLTAPLAVWIDGALQPQGFTAGGELAP
ncbi:MAG TPA: amidohydrolase family protein [Nannocystaceae bacterium]|nr:amidohydrolase family protein [Nannocystaceae bacterium]